MTGVQTCALPIYSSLPIKGVATRKENFMGRYNTEEKSQSILGDRFRESKLSSGEDGIASFLHQITLTPGQEKEFVVIAGQTKDRKSVKELIGKYKNISFAKKALDKTKEDWRNKILNNIIIETPDEEFNQLINVWTKYQLYICNYWSRSPSYYHEEIGRASCRERV